MRVEPGSLDQLLHPTIDPASNGAGDRHRPAGLPGAATGKIVFTAAEAEIQGGSAGAADPGGARRPHRKTFGARPTPRAASSRPVAA